MKRIVIAFLLAALFLAPAALAADRFYKSDVEEGGETEFRAIIKHDKAKRIYKFRWANVPTSCAGGPSATSYSDDGFDMKVGDDRRFHDSFEFGNATATAKGRFGKDPRKVSGTLRVQGSTAGCSDGDTGTVHWTHKPGGGAH
jgi:hypothetical protein